MATLEFKAEELPSRGITYPEGTIFTLQKFSYGEIQDLNTSSMSIETKIEKFRKALTINNPELKAEDIAYLDYLYMHLERTASVYDNDILQFPITCPYCENEVTHKVKFAELELNDISEYTDIMPLTYPIGGQEFSFSFLTLEKIIKWFRLVSLIQQNDMLSEIQKEHSEMQKKVEKITPENPDEVLQAKWEVIHKQYVELHGRLTMKNRAKAEKYKPYGLNALLLAFMCSDIGTDEFDQFLSKVNTVQGDAIEVLQFVENTLGIGLKPLKITCPHCAKIFVTNIEDNVNSIYPFRTSSADIANKLRALQKAKSASKPVEE